jgi:hypothetical protein
MAGNQDIDAVLQGLKQKFSHLSTKDIRAKIKEAFSVNNVPKKSKYHQVQLDLDNILSKIKDIPKTTFLKMAKDAWQKKYPEGREGRSNDYATFLSNNLKELRKQNPQSTHSERIKQAAILWEQYKIEHKIESHEDDKNEDEMDIVEEMPESTKKQKIKRSKNNKHPTNPVLAHNTHLSPNISEDEKTLSERIKKARLETRRTLRSNLTSNLYVPDSIDFPPLIS